MGESKTATQLSDTVRQPIMHAVKVLGWGTMSGKPYWLVENSWGDDWGENGYAKIIRANKQGILEIYMLAGIPQKNDDFEDLDSGTFDEEFQMSDTVDLDAGSDIDEEINHLHHD